MNRLFIILLLWLLRVSANADNTVLIEGIYYNLNFEVKEASVTSNPNLYSGVIAIPGSVSYGGYSYSVKSIGKGAFYICPNLKTVSIPSSVTLIGESAFYGCI